MTYDESNIFAKILRGELPCHKIYEDDNTLSFYDAYPKAKIHVLVVPKGRYKSFDAFVNLADQQEVTSFFNTVKEVTKKLDLVEPGYRLIVNHGKNGGQEVPHFHIHILGGEILGPMIS